ncbi:MAG: phosphate ABC transporter substrate-binding protein PstS [Leucobacter sp.]|nr:phosphate ABC transporter substrate-binding protein PstS [Leucobacter sp.]
MGALVTIAMLGLTACAANESPQANNGGESAALAGNLIGAGASSQGEAQNAWIASFLDVASGVDVTYDPAGSGTGRENFQQGASQYAGSDRAFKLDEIATGPFDACAVDSGLVELPAYISPIAVVFKLEGVETLNLDADALAGIFTGVITSWDDEAITSQNPGVQLPALSITPVHRADKSGTTGNFTDYLDGASDAWPFGSVEEWPIDGGEAAPGTSGVVTAVSGGNGTIGYVDASRAAGLGTVNVKVGADYVTYSPEAAAAVVDASQLEEGRGENDLAISLDRGIDAAGVYPVVLVSYLIGCETYADPAVSPLVREFFSFVVSEEGQRIAAENSGSAPISGELRERAQNAIDRIK